MFETASLKWFIYFMQPNKKVMPTCGSYDWLYFVYLYSRTSSSCVREDVLSGLFVPNQVRDCGFGTEKVLECPKGPTALLFLSDRKKERRLSASLSPSVGMCTASLYNYSKFIHCRFPSATETMERRSKSSPFPWAQLFSSHNQLLLTPFEPF